MNTTLPIFAKKDEIVRAVKENRTVIITAETGAGKSTQVPQYLYEAGFRVACTEPRRIACVSLASRVREEIEAEGNDPRLVGYETALEVDKFPETGILYCTDGLKLAQGIRDDGTVLVIDEVHEWNLNIEMLVAWVKKHRETGGSIRVVIMSATMDAEALQKFYGFDVTHIHAEGRMFEVEKHLKPESTTLDLKIEGFVKEGRNILIFRPGRKEIEETTMFVESVLDEAELSAVILPMYGDLPLDEQKKCFLSYDIPKIVIATNIAQTSLTIPDIDAVIDDGLEKYVKAENGIEVLMPHHISQADIEQRAGRAGRVRKGEYYLYPFVSPSIAFEKRDKWPEPDIQRLLLDQVVLRLASVGFDAEKMCFFHQPDQRAIQAAKGVLRLLGALDENGITELGRRLASYPVSARCALMIEKAREEGIVNDILEAVAIIEGGYLGQYRSSERRSDILSQMEFFEDIRSTLGDIQIGFGAKLSGILPRGVNEKAFIRVHDYMRRLSEFRVPGETNDRTTEEFYIKFLKCLCTAYPEQIFRKDFDEMAISYDTFYWSGFYFRSYKKSRDSITSDKPEWAICFPRHIVFTTKSGNVRSLEIVENISCITDEMLETVVDPSHIEIKEYICFFDEKEETVVVVKEHKYLGSFVFDCEIINLRPNDADYEKYRKYALEDKGRMALNRSHALENEVFFIINEGKRINVERIVENDRDFHIYFDSYLDIPEKLHMIMPDGSLPFLHYDDFCHVLPGEFKRLAMKKDFINTWNRTRLNSLKKYFEYRHILDKAFAAEEELEGETFLGLIYRNKRCSFYEYDSKKKRYAGTVDAIGYLIVKWFRGHGCYFTWTLPWIKELVLVIVKSESYEYAETVMRILRQKLKNGAKAEDIQKDEVSFYARHDIGQLEKLLEEEREKGNLPA